MTKNKLRKFWESFYSPFGYRLHNGRIYRYPEDADYGFSGYVLRNKVNLNMTMAMWLETDSSYAYVLK
jgi:hypothetical protein